MHYTSLSLRWGVGWVLGLKSVRCSSLSLWRRSQGLSTWFTFHRCMQEFYRRNGWGKWKELDTKARTWVCMIEGVSSNWCLRWSFCCLTWLPSSDWTMKDNWPACVMIREGIQVFSAGKFQTNTGCPMAYVRARVVASWALFYWDCFSSTNIAAWAKEQKIKFSPWDLSQKELLWRPSSQGVRCSMIREEHFGKFGPQPAFLCLLESLFDNLCPFLR